MASRVNAAGASARLSVGNMAPVLRFAPVVGGEVSVTGATRPTHVQFRRFAGCPICHLHIREFQRRIHEIRTHVQEVILFHSGAEELAGHAWESGLAIVADPGKDHYRAFGVEEGARALIDPRVWPKIVSAVAQALIPVMLRRQRAPSLNPTGGRLGLPADFLIDPAGRILACKYGDHADDQWSVDEMLALARGYARHGSDG